MMNKIDYLQEFYKTKKILQNNSNLSIALHNLIWKNKKKSKNKIQTLMKKN